MKEYGLQQNENDAVYPSTEGEAEYASKEEAAKALADAYNNVKNFHKRLLYFTLKFIRYYFNADTFRNTTAEDVVQIILERIITQKRKWYRVKIPDFHKFIRLAILSYVRNERKKKDKFERVNLYDEDGRLSEEKIDELIKEYAREDIIEKYFRDDLETLIEVCLNKLKDDVYAAFVFEQSLEGVKSNIEIAKNLGIESREVENAKKRIKNKFQKLLGKK